MLWAYPQTARQGKIISTSNITFQPFFIFPQPYLQLRENTQLAQKSSVTPHFTWKYITVWGKNTLKFPIRTDFWKIKEKWDLGLLHKAKELLTYAQFWWFSNRKVSRSSFSIWQAWLWAQMILLNWVILDWYSQSFSEKLHLNGPRSLDSKATFERDKWLQTFWLRPGSGHDEEFI